MRSSALATACLGALGAVALAAAPAAAPRGGGGAGDHVRAPDGRGRSLGPRQEGTPPNVLVLLADDVGVDMVGAYAEGGDLPPTPNVDSLAASGVLFRNAWAMPVCSPTRAAILTGRPAVDTGIGFVISPTGATIDDDEVIVPEMLDAGTAGSYSHAAFGKWHLHNDLRGGALGPNTAGFGYFSGSKRSLLAPEDYFNWVHVVNGSSTLTTQYEPELITDEAIDWMNGQTQPFFCYLAFNLGHDPYHRPPDYLHTVNFTGVDPDPMVEPRPYYKAMVEAMDTLIGRILTQLDPALLANTLIVFLGDNGTPQMVTVPPFLQEHAKTTLYEGGVNVPFIVSGPGVQMPGSECAALIHATDIYATVAELAGVDLAATFPQQSFDSVSLVPYLTDPSTPSIRDAVYSEVYYPNSEPAQGPLPYLCDPPGPLSTAGGGFYTSVRGGDELVCARDMGLAGPGSARLKVCGPPLHSTASALIEVQGGPPGAMGFLFEGNDFQPQPFAMGVVAPSPDPWFVSYMISLDSNGRYQQVLTHRPGIEFLYLQAAVVDLGVPGGFAVTNAVEARMFSHEAAARNDRYKLIVDLYSCAESFYDLSADPLEQMDLLQAPLDPTQQAAHDELRAFIAQYAGF